MSIDPPVTPAPDPGLARLWIAIAVAAFAFNLAWEYLECQPFFVHGTLPQGGTELLVASLGDVVLTALAYALVALFVRDWHWPLARWTLLVWSSQVVLALVLATLVELHALRTGRWSYSADAPRVPATSISIVPLLQLLVLFPASFGVGRLAGSRRR